MHHIFWLIIDSLTVDTPILSNPRLLIKSAILMPTAKKDDINIVEIESEGYNQEKVRSSVKILQIHIQLLGTFLKPRKCKQSHAIKMHVIK